MTKAKDIFRVFKWANYITKNSSGRIYVWENKPVKQYSWWDGNTVGKCADLLDLDIYEVEDFKGKSWKKCIIKREKEVKTPNDLKRWLNKCKYVEKNENCVVKSDYVFKMKFSNSFVSHLYIDIRNEYTEMFTRGYDIVFIGSAEEVKRVLELLIEIGVGNDEI